MTSYIQSNKRIAKNTLMLYLRTFITILVSLYTSRVILEVLGIEDFGIYNIVGGVVVMFSFITAAMTSATQRFLNFELGRIDGGDVERIFSMSMTAHICIAFVVMLLGETVGLWFINTQLNIPVERMDAVHWVYQFSLLTTCINIVCVPYNAIIVAHERMAFYAYMSILESVMKLGIVYVVAIGDIDKLILYGGLILAVRLVVVIVYKLFCNKRFASSHYKFFWDSVLFSQLMSFSGWSLLGGAANVGATQGINILLNIFYGVAVNAAMGVATQVMTTVNSFVSNFQIAFQPQIVKLYAAAEQNRFLGLINQTSRLSFYLSFAIALPFIICAEPILHLWLKDVPEYAVQFTQLLLIFVLIDAISGPLWMASSATGRIKWFMIITSGIRFLNLPLVYIAFKFGAEPQIAVVIKVTINLLTHLSRIILLNRMIGLNVRKFLIDVMLRCVIIALLVAPLPVLVYINTSGFFALILTVLTSITVLGIVIYTIGITKSERITINENLIKIVR